MIVTTLLLQLSDKSVHASDFLVKIEWICQFREQEEETQKREEKQTKTSILPFKKYKLNINEILERESERE